MSTDQASRRPAGKAGGSAPMSTTLMIVITVIAVVAGFLILQNITDGDDDPSVTDSPTTDTTGETIATGDTAAPGDTGATAVSVVDSGPPTTPALNTDPAQIVIVANASGIGGAAGQYTKALAGAGFTTGTATDSTTGELPLSVVYFLPGGEAVAASVAQAMGSLGTPPSGVVAAAMPATPPIKGATMPAGATVLVMLGTDRANKALPMNEGTAASSDALPTAPIDSTTTTVAG